MQLRKYQSDLINKARELLKTHRAIIVCLATGGGKSVIEANILKSLSDNGKRGYLLSHRHEIFKQLVQHLIKQGVFPGQITSGQRMTNNLIQVAMVQTLFRKLKYLDKIWPALIMPDECLDGRNMIMTPTGLEYLKNLNIGDEVLTPTGTAKIKNKWTTYKQAYSYNTNKGSLIASNNHLVPNENNEIINIENATRLLINQKTNTMFEIPGSHLFGWYLADGTFDNGNLKFAFRKKEKINFFLHNNTFSKYLKHIINKRGDWIFSFRDKQYRKMFIERFGIGNEKKIPDLIYKSCSVGFLRGIFSGDGYRTDRRIGLDLSQKDFIIKIKNILNYYGIYPTLTEYKRNNTKHKTRYRLSISGKYINIYNNLIGWDIEEKAKEYNIKTWNKYYKSTPIRTTEKLNKLLLIDIELDNQEKLFYANGFLVHNCHHYCSPTFSKIINYKEDTKIIGFTATPQRTDGQGLNMAGFTAMIEGPQNYDLIQAGYLTPPVILSSESTKLFREQKWKKKNKEINEEQQMSFASQKVIVDDTLNCYRKYFNGAPAIIFCCSVSDSELIAARLRGDGWKAEALHEKIPNDERQKMLDGLANGNINIITCYDIIGEGVDIPILSGIIIRRLTCSLINWLQWCGRALRRSPGKKHAIIIDQAGNIFEHGHPLLIRNWTLDGKIKEKSEDDIKIKQCPSCNAWIMRNVRICQYCGEDLTKIKPEKPKEIKILNAPLVEIKLPEIMTGRVAVDLADVMECQEQDIDNEIIESIKQIRESKDDMRHKLELISKYFNKSHQWTEKAWSMINGQ